MVRHYNSARLGIHQRPLRAAFWSAASAAGSLNDRRNQASFSSTIAALERVPPRGSLPVTDLIHRSSLSHAGAGIDCIARSGASQHQGAESICANVEMPGSGTSPLRMKKLIEMDNSPRVERVRSRKRIAQRVHTLRHASFHRIHRSTQILPDENSTEQQDEFSHVRYFVRPIRGVPKAPARFCSRRYAETHALARELSNGSENNKHRL